MTLVANAIFLRSLPVLSDSGAGHWRSVFSDFKAVRPPTETLFSGLRGPEGSQVICGVDVIDTICD